MQALSRFVRVELAAPSYLSMPSAGIDISTSGIKIARVAERLHGLELVDYGDHLLPEGTVVNGELRDPAKVAEGIRTLMKKHRIRFANVALPESRGYLFEATVAEEGFEAQQVAVERRLEEYVPLPSTDVSFVVSPLEKTEGGTRMVGVGYARRVVEETLAVMDDAKVTVRALESETFSLSRALLPSSSDETVLIIDLGKTTTKLLVVTKRLPRYVTTLDIGGHSLTLAVQKYFGVSEEEARRVKAEKGIAPGAGNEEYLAAMLSTASVIRDEIAKRLEYWQGREGQQEPVTRAILTGGNAAILGLPEYLESALKVPVALGDVFANFASRDTWLPPLSYNGSLAYGTAIGLALRDHAA